MQPVLYGPDTTTWPSSYEAAIDDAPQLHPDERPRWSPEPPAEALQAPTTTAAAMQATTRTPTGEARSVDR
jgi:hypothetical protein